MSSRRGSGPEEPTGSQGPILISVAETARRLSVSPTWVRRAIWNGKLKACVVRLGRAVRIDAALLMDEIRGGQQ